MEIYFIIAFTSSCYDCRATREAINRGKNPTRVKKFPPALADAGAEPDAAAERKQA
jgi:hypothetical protein